MSDSSPDDDATEDDGADEAEGQSQGQEGPDFLAEHDAMITHLDGAIKEINAKIESGRIRSPEHDKVRIQYFRALGYLIRTKRKVLEDQALEELAEEIEALREQVESSPPDESTTTDYQLHD